MCVAPMKPNVKATKAPEVIGHSVAIGQIGARPKANLAPFELCVTCQDLGEASMGDRLVEQVVNASIEAIQQMLLFLGAGPAFQAPPVVGGVVVAREDHRRDGGPRLPTVFAGLPRAS